VFAGRVPEDGEPLWLPEDRDVVSVWQAHQNKCPTCGTWDWEWQENPEAWVADLWRCPGCEQVDEQHTRMKEATSNTDGLQVRMFKPERED
jgi:hypothetical protein